MSDITPTFPALLTVSQAAHQLAVSRRTLERLISAEEFPRPLKIGRSTRVPKEDVEAYLDGLRSRRDAQAKSHLAA